MLPSVDVDSITTCLSSLVEDRPPSEIALDVGLVSVGIWLLLKGIRVARSSRRSVTTTRLRGPPSPSYLFGVGEQLEFAPNQDSGALFEAWSKKYGAVYQVPSAFGVQRVVLFDVRAIAHVFARDAGHVPSSTESGEAPGAKGTYDHLAFTKLAVVNLIGKGVLWASGDNHKRQRKALTPAFSNAAIREVTPIFFDSAYKVKNIWDELLTSSSTNDEVVEVQRWMNHISLDSIGLAGFSHDFGAIYGKKSAVTETFDAFSTTPPTKFFRFMFVVLGLVFPWFVNLPTARTQMSKKLNDAMAEIAEALLKRTRREKEQGGNEGEKDRSVIGALLRAETAGTELHLSHQEILDSMKVLLLAGYETTSTSLTWALIELSKNQTAQSKLREELSKLSTGDPTYDQLTSNSLPYLDGVVHEILRLHPVANEVPRVVVEDDIMPLSEPLLDASGKTISSVAVVKGTNIVVPVEGINRSEALWGPDAKAFRPERWLEDGLPDGIPPQVKDVQGYRHLLTFIDGPRICLGRHFAVAEFKAVLSVLIRNFTFDFATPDAKVEVIRSFLFRPKIVGEQGVDVPLRIRRVE